MVLANTWTEKVVLETDDGVDKVLLNWYNNADKIVSDYNGNIHIVWSRNGLSSEIRYCTFDPDNIEGTKVIETIWPIGCFAPYAYNPCIAYGKVENLGGYYDEYIFVAWEGGVDKYGNTDIYLRWRFNGTWSDVVKVTNGNLYAGAPCIDVPENQTFPGIDLIIAWEDYRYAEVLNNGEVFYKDITVDGTCLVSISIDKRITFSDENTFRASIDKDIYGNIHFVYNDMSHIVEHTPGGSMYTHYVNVMKPYYKSDKSMAPVMLYPSDYHKGMKMFNPRICFIKDDESPPNVLGFVSYNWPVYWHDKSYDFITRYKSTRQGGGWGDKYYQFTAPFINPNGQVCNYTDAPQLGYNEIDNKIYFIDYSSDLNVKHGLYFGSVSIADEYWNDDEIGELKTSWIDVASYEGGIKTLVSYADIEIDDNGVIHIVWNEGENPRWGMPTCEDKRICYSNYNPVVSRSFNKNKEIRDLRSDEHLKCDLDLREKEDLVDSDFSIILKNRDCIEKKQIEHLVNNSFNCVSYECKDDVFIERDGNDIFNKTTTINSSCNINDTFESDDVLSSYPNVTIDIYPNPSEDFLYIYLRDTYENRNKDIKLYDISGRLIEKRRLSMNEFNYEIDVSNLPTGIYFVIVEGYSEPIIKKIVVCH